MREIVQRHEFRVVKHSQRKRLKVEQLSVGRVHLRQDKMLERYGCHSLGMHNTE